MGSKENKMIKVLDSLMEEKAGVIKVTCLGSKKCKEGFCDASLFRKNNTFTLVTGADRSGKITFHTYDILDVSSRSIVAIGHVGCRGFKIKLELKD